MSVAALLFAAGDLVSGRELSACDGTEADTVRPRENLLELAGSEYDRMGRHMRIVHLSDLHLAKPGASVLPKADQSLLQRVTKYVLEEHGVSINVKVHDPLRLQALETQLKTLNPDLILITGDLTTYGDVESMNYAAELLTKWKKQFQRLYCVPGNHDALQERFVELKSQEGLGSKTLGALTIAFKSFENIFSSKSTPGIVTRVPFLNAYDTYIGEPLDTVSDPSRPKWIETTWGWVALFLFNSVNDPGWMANEGRIGPEQFNLLNEGLTTTEYSSRKESTLRIALLHHHPLPIPYAPDTPGERFYDDMRDGSTMCHYLNKHDFHMVLHGHKHRPYKCRIEYEGKAGLYVIAAGAATQSEESFESASFNVIDIMSPFHAFFRRYGHRETGFELVPGTEHVMNITPVGRLRYSPPGKPESEVDVDVRNFVTFNPAGVEENHEFITLEWNAVLDDEHNYLATYRLAGRVTSESAQGIRQLITGSPARTLPELGLKAYSSGNSADSIGIKVLEDHPRRKCIDLLHPVELYQGDAFDYTYTFNWKQGPPGEDFFDGFNLSYYRGNIEEVKFSILLPYSAAAPSVERLGFSQESTKVKIKRETLGSNFKYSFTMSSPARVFYIVKLASYTNA